MQDSIGMSEGTLAFALMGMPLGLLAALPFGSKVAEILGTRGLLTVGLGSYLLTMPLPAFAVSTTTMFVGLAITGVSMAIAQLSLNVTASEVEARGDRPIMNGCHGFWSIGVLVGSAIGAVMAEARIAPGVSLVLVSAVCFIPLLGSARAITDYAIPAAKPTQDARAPLSRPLVFIALFGFGIAMTEGAMADWLAVFLTNIFDVSPGIAGAGYTVFALSVAIGRFQGDVLKTRFAVEKLAQGLVGLALMGLMVVVFSPWVWLSFVGVGMLGCGVSLGFPLAVSAASVMEGRSSAGNVAVLTQITLCGFLVGPPMIGVVAQFSNMRIGLGALIPALLMAFVFAQALKPRNAP
jgi:predicted MFS family arabinose efflux permease